MAYNEDSSASGHDEPWIQWCVQYGLIDLRGQLSFLFITRVAVGHETFDIRLFSHIIITIVLYVPSHSGSVD